MNSLVQKCHFSGNLDTKFGYFWLTFFEVSNFINTDEIYNYDDVVVQKLPKVSHFLIFSAVSHQQIANC